MIAERQYLWLVIIHLSSKSSCAKNHQEGEPTVRFTSNKDGPHVVLKS
jgi:hypothetical protein